METEQKVMETEQQVAEYWNFPLAVVCELKKQIKAVDDQHVHTYIEDNYRGWWADKADFAQHIAACFTGYDAEKDNWPKINPQWPFNSIDWNLAADKLLKGPISEVPYFVIDDHYFCST